VKHKEKQPTTWTAKCALPDLAGYVLSASAALSFPARYSQRLRFVDGRSFAAFTD